jgi:hypothetical protein
MTSIRIAIPATARCDHAARISIIRQPVDFDPVSREIDSIDVGWHERNQPLVCRVVIRRRYPQDRVSAKILHTGNPTEHDTVPVNHVEANQIGPVNLIIVHDRQHRPRQAYFGASQCQRDFASVDAGELRQNGA